MFYNNCIKIIFIIFFFLIKVKIKKVNITSPYFINYNSNNLNSINNNINLLLNFNKTKIENIFILIVLMPFLKTTLKIKKTKKRIEFFELIKYIFNKTENNYYIKINPCDFHFFIKQFNNTINYQWELIPQTNIINNLRYILIKYYNEVCLEIFDKSLNFNFEFYIKVNKNKLKFNEIYNLLSKFDLYLIILENIGIYKKEKFIGKGTTGFVSIIIF